MRFQHAALLAAPNEEGPHVFARLILRRHSPRRLRWVLRLYPPFLLARIRPDWIAPDFTSAHVRVRRSRLTRNLNGTTFGGAISAAVDPLHAVLLWQALVQQGVSSRAWTKRSAVRFLAPATKDLIWTIELRAQDIAAARSALERGEDYEETFSSEARDTAGTLCAVAETTVVLRRVLGGASARTDSKGADTGSQRATEVTP